MPYTVKVVSSCADKTLSEDVQVAKVRGLYQNDFVHPECDLGPIHQLRHRVTTDGTLLARGSIIINDGKAVQTTTVWRSKASYDSYKNDPAMQNYLAKMKEDGWDIEFTFI